MVLFRPKRLMIFNPGHFADGCSLFAFSPGLKPRVIIIKPFQGIKYQPVCYSSFNIPNFFFILQTRAFVLFRPQRLMIFNPGHLADGSFAYLSVPRLIPKFRDWGYSNLSPVGFFFSFPTLRNGKEALSLILSSSFPLRGNKKGATRGNGKGAFIAIAGTKPAENRGYRR